MNGGVVCVSSVVYVSVLCVGVVYVDNSIESVQSV